LTEPLLRVRGLRKAFDSLLALDGVDLDLASGEVHALLGENGAGKTTLANILAGIYQPDAGSLHLDGREVHFRSPREALAAGVGMVHQHFNLIESMTVAENLFLGWDRAPRFVTRPALRAAALSVANDYGMSIEPDRPVWSLSIGERQRLEIVRVLARGARILILDEPTSVLTDADAEELFGNLRGLTATGTTVVFISHKLREVFAVSDRITVLRQGSVVGSAPASEFDKRSVAALMTGSDRHGAPHAGKRTFGDPVLRLRRVFANDIRRQPALRGIDLDVRGGEILGVAGVSGNGQSELALVASGLLTPTAGTVEVAGSDLTRAGPQRFQQEGVGHIAEDRLRVALVRSQSVLDNAVMRHYRLPVLSSRLRLRPSALRRCAEELVTRGRVQLRSVAAPVSQLSGGNQQRLVAAREADLGKRVLIAVHPTRGLDVGAAAEVQETIVRRAESGCAVLLISDDLDEILQLSDRVVVMFAGEIAGDMQRSEADRAVVGLLMGGHHREDRPA